MGGASIFKEFETYEQAYDYIREQLNDGLPDGIGNGLLHLSFLLIVGDWKRWYVLGRWNK